MSLYMTCCTETIISEVRRGFTQPQIGQSYGLAMLSEAAGVDKPDWIAINAAILDRWKMRGLERIKAIAWKIMDARNVYPTLRIKRLTPTATLPTRGSPGAIGLDLYADGFTVIPAGGRCLCQTNVAAAIPPTHYGRLAPRSGLAVKYGVDVLAGVVDSDYRGAIGVALLNTGREPFTVRPGDRIAQLILERADILPVIEVDDLDATERGAGGFGSSGVA